MAAVMSLDIPAFGKVAEPNGKAENRDQFSALAAATAAAPANEGEIFEGKADLMKLDRSMARTEQECSKATSRVAAALGKVESLNAKQRAAEQIIAKGLERIDPQPAPFAHAVASTSRAARMVENLNTAASEYTSRKPSKSEHLRAFEDLNRQIGEAQRAYDRDWSPVREFIDSKAGNFTPDELQAVIAKTGAPTKYHADAENIQKLSLESAEHLEKLSDHLSAYRRKHGDDEFVREAGERVRDSINDLSEGAVPQIDGDGQLIDDVTKTLRAIIEKMIELLRKLFGCDDEADKPAGPQ